MYLHFFFAGILLADLYCSNFVLIKNSKAGLEAGLLSLLCYLFFPWMDSPAGYGVKILSISLLTHIVLTNPYFKRLFSIQGFVLIGGMCYSIYLLHFAIIAAAGSMLLKWTTIAYNPVYCIPFFIFFIFLVLVISALYFVLAERPFMKPRGLKKTPAYQ